MDADVSSLRKPMDRHHDLSGSQHGDAMSAVGRDMACEGPDESFLDSLKWLALLITISGLLWWSFNNFSVAEPEGFDPLRYEYYARYGLPNYLAGSSSYRIVIVLEYIYQFLPNYIGYLFVIGMLAIATRYYDADKIISWGVFSPVALYYIAQTGKDGIAVLALIATAIAATNWRSAGSILTAAIIVTLGFYVRPAIGLVLPLAFIQFRFGTLWAICAVPFLVYAFSLNADTYEVLSTLEGVSADEGSGRLALLLRLYTFGYDSYAIIFKSVLLLISVLFQPFLGLSKFYAGAPAFVLLEGTCFLLFIYGIYRRKIFYKFLLSSLPYILIIGYTSPFYHFRYLAVTYPVIYAFCIWSRGRGWNFVRLSPGDEQRTREGQSPVRG